MTRKLSFSLNIAAALVAASLSGCFGDSGGTTVPQPAPGSIAATPVEFSSFVEVTFSEPANSTPTNFDTTVFVYDVNNDPTAFDTLLM